MEPIPVQLTARDGGTLAVGQTFFTVYHHQVLAHTVSGIHRLVDCAVPTFVVVSSGWVHHISDCYVSRDSAAAHCRERLEYLQGYYQREAEMVQGALNRLHEVTQQGESACHASSEL